VIVVGELAQVGLGKGVKQGSSIRSWAVGVGFHFAEHRFELRDGSLERALEYSCPPESSAVGSPRTGGGLAYLNGLSPFLRGRLLGTWTRRNLVFHTHHSTL